MAKPGSFAKPISNIPPTSPWSNPLTTSRESYSARQWIVSAGSWLGSLLPDVASVLRIERQVMFWFEPASSPASFRPEACPIHLWEDGADRFFYGFPDLGQGLKVACH